MRDYQAQGIAGKEVKRRSHAKRRDANEPEIVEALRAIPNLKVVLLDRPADLLVGYAGMNWLFEVSNPATHARRAGGSKRQDGQLEFARDWPGQYTEVEGVKQIIDVITGRAFV